MELSKGSITGITIAIIAILIASFGVFLYLRRRRRRQRRATNAAAAPTATSISATTSSTTPSSHKNNNASESHVIQSRKKVPSGVKNHHHHPQASDTRNLNLGNGFDATPTATVDKTMRNNTSPRDSQGLMANKTTFPALGGPTPAEPTSSDDIAVRDGPYAMDTMAGTRPTAPARLTADFSVDLEQQPHFAFSDRPSSLHQAVLEVGGKDEVTENVDGTTNDGEPKREDSNNIDVNDVRTRPTGYTGAWP